MVGDDAQAIYSFRAASVENIRGFPARFSSHVISLEENYRSTQRILDAANALIGKRLRSVKGAVRRPEIPRGGACEGRARAARLRAI